MDSWIHIFLLVHLLFIKGYMNENIYCKEAVESVKHVSSCPTSKEQWDKAASRKKCWEKALKQNCSVPEKFVYHCVINGYVNATLEVCAPHRIILGHCTEFNEVGGVIQDQLFSLCNDVFPRCDEYYLSFEAYKYEDCYKLVEAQTLITSTSKNKKHVPSDETTNGDETTILILAVGISVIGVVSLVCVFVYAYRRKIDRWRSKEMESLENIISIGQTHGIKVDQKEVHEKEIPNVYMKVTESKENAEDSFLNKSCPSPECRNDDPEVLSESQSLTGQLYGKNKLGVSEVKHRSIEKRKKQTA